MGLLTRIDGGGGASKLSGQPIAGSGAPRAVVKPQGSIGVLHVQAGQPDIAGDVLHPGAEGAVLPAIAIAARRTAALAAMHPASRAAVNRGGAAGLTRASAGTAAWGVGEDVGLHGREIPFRAEEGRRGDYQI